MADVESANIVGYTGKAVEAGKYYLIATQFNKPGAEAGTIDMNDLVQLSKDITPGEYDTDFVGAPVIQVLTSSGGYDMYYYISDATDEDDNPLGYDCWADFDGYELTKDAKLELGKGFWFKSDKAGTITVAGEVSAEADAVVNFPANSFAIIANPFPKAFSFADVKTTGITPGEYATDFAGASVIQVLTSAGGYDMYYYISDATDDKDNEVGYNCWADFNGYILDGNQVEVGASFWIKGNANGSIGFTK